MFRQWADEKVLVAEASGWLHGYADRVELMAAELVSDVETYLGKHAALRLTDPGWDA